MEVTCTHEASTIATAPAGALVVTETLSGPTFSILSATDSDRRDCIDFKPGGSSDTPRAIASDYNLHHNGDDICFVVPSAILRPDPTSFTRNFATGAPAGSLVMTNGQLHLYAGSDRPMDRGCLFNFETNKPRYGSPAPSCYYYSRWSFVVPNGPIAETTLYTFDADA